MVEIYKKYMSPHGKGTLVYIYPDRKNGTMELEDKTAKEVVFDLKLSELKEI